MKIDFERAWKAFAEYLRQYDNKDEKIRLKIVHTYGVVACAREIAGRMRLPEEDRELAALIALLHDIGRFEQLKRFDSFEPGTMDHAAYGALLLFGDMAKKYRKEYAEEAASEMPSEARLEAASEMPSDTACEARSEAAAEMPSDTACEAPMIRRFLPEDQYDEIICQAIALHSDFQLPEIADERALLHARLIRDADKLDNCRVKLEESVEAMIGATEEETGRGRISDRVWEACLQKRSVLSEDRVSKVDYWVSYIAQYYDLNFPETWEIIREKGYIPAIAGRIHYREPETAARMVELVSQMQEYMEDQIGLSYTVIRSSRKTISLEVHRDGQILVRAPRRMSEQQIRRFVEKRALWVEKSMEKIRKRQEEEKQAIPVLSPEKRAALRQEAARIFPDRVRYFAGRVGVDFGRITIREQKTRWGSCSSAGNLNFNWKLMLAPADVLDYVVVHELCHRKEMNHSPAFWREVARVLPDYERQKHWLKDNGWKLLRM